MRSQAAVRAIAVYLPQFHPIPENDRWWGRGFTEWTNVTRATSLFPWHYQPHLPADLGFYDLRLPEVREQQAELAREYGIYGFCYYHYWFHGRRLLERPFDEVLESGRPDFPFCLCWANENWNRAWDGTASEVLVQQQYSDEDDRQHLHWLRRAFVDDRYIRVDGRPLFLVYRISYLPDPLRTAEIWRDEARKLGIGELFLANMQSSEADIRDPQSIGFDAAVEFQPDWGRLGPRLYADRFTTLLQRAGVITPHYTTSRIFDYRQLMENVLAKPQASYLRYPGVMPMWDNSARRLNGPRYVFKGSTPELYEQWLTEAIRRFLPEPHEHNFVFINAWNEWAEGNHLEPCQRWGRAYLEATQQALYSAQQRPRVKSEGAARELCRET